MTSTPPVGAQGLHDVDRSVLDELAPMLRRAVELDPAAVARLLVTASDATVLIRLPFGVLASRTVAVPAAGDTTDPAAHAGHATRGRLDLTVRAAQTIAWLAGERADLPDNRDAEWRGGTPPRAGWRRLDTVPDDVVRGLVRAGALALRDAAEREGVPGAQPRAEVADALLDSVVLTVDDPDGPPTEVTLRALSALTRMGFLPRDGWAGVDVRGRWTRVAAGYGSVYVERPGAGLELR